MNKELKLKQLGFSLTEQNFALVVDPSALYETNAIEMYRKALIGENASRSRWTLITGVKDRIKLGTNDFVSVVKPGACDFDPSDANISQKTFEVCPIMVGTAFCIDDLETTFVSDQIRKGSANFTEPQPFMNFFYESLQAEVNRELEILSFRGDTTGGFTGADAYLLSCDGLEKKLTNDLTVLKPVSPSAVTSLNVIDKLKEARDAVSPAVRRKSDFVYQVSQNVYDALQDAVADNKASGLYYVDFVNLKFQGVEIVLCDGASDNVIIAGSLSNFLNITDLASDTNGFNVVDFMKTTLSRKLGVRTDAKISFDYKIGEEIYFHIA